MCFSSEIKRYAAMNKLAVLSILSHYERLVDQYGLPHTTVAKEVEELLEQQEFAGQAPHSIGELQALFAATFYPGKATLVTVVQTDLSLFLTLFSSPGKQPHDLFTDVHRTQVYRGSMLWTGFWLGLFLANVVCWEGCCVAHGVLNTVLCIGSHHLLVGDYTQRFGMSCSRRFPNQSLHHHHHHHSAD
jgi:hypothetical protein